MRRLRRPEKWKITYKLPQDNQRLAVCKANFFVLETSLSTGKYLTSDYNNKRETAAG
jgi:hypothetical protein